MWGVAGNPRSMDQIVDSGEKNNPKDSSDHSYGKKTVGQWLKM